MFCLWWIHFSFVKRTPNWFVCLLLNNSLESHQKNLNRHVTEKFSHDWLLSPTTDNLMLETLANMDFWVFSACSKPPSYLLHLINDYNCFFCLYFAQISPDFFFFFFTCLHGGGRKKYILYYILHFPRKFCIWSHNFFLHLLAKFFSDGNNMGGKIFELWIIFHFYIFQGNTILLQFKGTQYICKKTQTFFKRI